ALPFLVGEVGGDDHAVPGVTVEPDGYGEVTHLPRLAVVAAFRRLAHRRHLCGEVRIVRQQHRGLLPALIGESAVDVAEELLVGAGEVVRDGDVEHLVHPGERTSRGGVDTAFGERAEHPHHAALRLRHATVVVFTGHLQ